MPLNIYQKITSGVQPNLVSGNSIKIVRIKQTEHVCDQHNLEIAGKTTHCVGHRGHTLVAIFVPLRICIHHKGSINIKKTHGKEKQNSEKILTGT